MALTKLKGAPIYTVGDLPAVGSKAPEFKLTTNDLRDVTLRNFVGHRLICNIVPSLDTEVCATSARRFNEAAASLHKTMVLTISNDLPFAQKRFCEAAGIEHVVLLSQMRDRAFGKDYGVAMLDGPLEGLLARAIVVIDSNGKVAYTQLVPDIAEEPDYQAALQAARDAD